MQPILSRSWIRKPDKNVDQVVRLGHIARVSARHRRRTSQEWGNQAWSID